MCEFPHMTGMEIFIRITPLAVIMYAGIGIPCAASDLENGMVPRAPFVLLIPALIASYAGSAFIGSLFGAGAGISAFWAVRKLTRNGLGLADVWMAGATGALGGAGFCAEATLAAIAFTAPRAFFLLRTKSRAEIPFLPSLLAGAFFSLFLDLISGK